MARPYDHTSLGGVDGQFPKTAWTQMLGSERHDQVLAELCKSYWKPVYCYLRAMGFGNEQAKDLAQGFFTDKVLGQDLIDKADRAKGRFRNFLLRSVRNYALSVCRTEKVHLSIDDSHERESPAGNPEREFERAWADQLLQKVLADLKAECLQRGKETHWSIFHEWLLDPAIEQKRTMNEICLRHGIPDPARAYHMIENIKRRFRLLLRSHLREVVASNADAEAEICEFIDIFSSGTARIRGKPRS